MDERIAAHRIDDLRAEVERLTADLAAARAAAVAQIADLDRRLSEANRELLRLPHLEREAALLRAVALAAVARQDAERRPAWWPNSMLALFEASKALDGALAAARAGGALPQADEAPR